MTPATLMSWEDAVRWLRAQPESAELVKACFYDDPLTEAAKRYWQSSEWRAVGRFLPAARGTALDIGAGRGISSYALAREGFSVTALEPDPSTVVGADAIRALAKAADLTIRVVETWGEELPFAPSSFDLVHCRQVLHHARDLTQLCRQVGRVLKPGGVFIATREHVLSHKKDLTEFLNKHPLHKLYGGENAYLLREYVEAISGSGITLEHTLNPMQSDINLFPETLLSTKQRWAKKIGLPIASILPDAALSLFGSFSSTPGRVYSFVGRKKSTHA